MKTENLTVQEAWQAMARGECVKANNFYIHRIRKNALQFFSDEKWVNTCELDDAPYSIVPDPSKPKDVELGEYEKDRVKVVESRLYPTLEDERSALICFIEKYYQRKP